MVADVSYLKKMIIINLKGGLGNQMFQYATGRSLVNKNDAELFLDKTGLEKTAYSDTPRAYELGNFNIIENFVDENKLKKVKYPYGTISKGFRFINARILKKNNLDYHPEFLKNLAKKFRAQKNVYLDGFFQSEKNFSDVDLEVRETLLKEFTLKEEEISNTFREMSGRIFIEDNSVSIHIRRGDYVENTDTNKYHGTCSLSYYKEAIKIMKDKVEKIDEEKTLTLPIRFYIFSDDIEWVKENLEITDNKQFVSDKKLSYQEELILMSKCKHNIIANSSFSWWGAWLNQNSDKIVIAPTPWVDKKHNPHKNITPESWLCIPKN